MNILIKNLIIIRFFCRIDVKLTLIKFFLKKIKLNNNKVHIIIIEFFVDEMENLTVVKLFVNEFNSS